jgi:hypothetical protein
MGVLSAQNFLESAKKNYFWNAKLAKDALFHIFSTILQIFFKY